MLTRRLGRILILTLLLVVLPAGTRAQMRLFRRLEDQADAAPLITFPGSTWEIKTPEEAGMDSARLDEFAARVGGSGVIIKDGYLVKSWGDPTLHGEWGSASKPVMSTLLFFAVHEGRLASVDERVENWGWEGQFIPKDKSMTFRHLADMTSGYARGEAPGSHWAYNDYAIKLYSLTLFEHVFNINSTDAAAVERLLTDPDRLGPLQFEDGNLFRIKLGAPRINMSPRDFARLGWFWLNKGNWQGQQLLPQSFFDNYMKPDVPGSLPRTTIAGSDYLNLGTSGGSSDQTGIGPGIYGFNWWFNAQAGTTGNLTWPDAPPDTFQANGHWQNEVMTIIPSLNLVVAARGDWGSFQPGDPNAGMNQNLKLLAGAVLDPSLTPTPETSPTATATPTPTPTPTNTPLPDTPSSKRVFLPVIFGVP